MKIQEYVRVKYESNPIAEVICQARFIRAAALVDRIPDDLRSDLSALGYVKESVEEAFNISVAVGSARSAQATQEPLGKIFHFDCESEPRRVSLSADFVAMTCGRYSQWVEFRPLFLGTLDVVKARIGDFAPIRLGLRYKDVVERERLGLDGIPWSQLIAPFLLGPLAANSLADNQGDSDESVSTFVSQATIRLADCQLLLQSSLLRSMDGGRTAFLIDSDFFVESTENEPLSGAAENIEAALNTLHTNAGSLFRRGITEKLHHALRPIAI